MSTNLMAGEPELAAADLKIKLDFQKRQLDRKCVFTGIDEREWTIYSAFSNPFSSVLQIGRPRLRGNHEDCDRVAACGARGNAGPEQHERGGCRHRAREHSCAGVLWRVREGRVFEQFVWFETHHGPPILTHLPLFSVRATAPEPARGRQARIAPERRPGRFSGTFVWSGTRHGPPVLTDLPFFSV